MPVCPLNEITGAELAEAVIVIVILAADEYSPSVSCALYQNVSTTSWLLGLSEVPAYVYVNKPLLLYAIEPYDPVLGVTVENGVVLEPPLLVQKRPKFSSESLSSEINCPILIADATSLVCAPLIVLTKMEN